MSDMVVFNEIVSNAPYVNTQPYRYFQFNFVQTVNFQINLYRKSEQLTVQVGEQMGYLTLNYPNKGLSEKLTVRICYQTRHFIDGLYREM